MPAVVARGGPGAALGAGGAAGAVLGHAADVNPVAVDPRRAPRLGAESWREREIDSVFHTSLKIASSLP